ncbi:MAG: hypothetical protein AB7I30_08600 [Isosphaeraceae bacterium]
MGSQNSRARNTRQRKYRIKRRREMREHVRNLKAEESTASSQTKAENS